MAKLSELFDPEKPGSVKVRRLSWRPDLWFQPYYVAGPRSDWFYGRQYDKDSNCYIDEGDNWVLFKEPKPKTVVFECVYQTQISGRYSVAWLTEHEFKESSMYDYKKTGRSFEV